MESEPARRNLIWVVLSAVRRWARSTSGRGKHRPPAAGVREPRRPRPTLPAAAVALAEPRAGLLRRIRLTNLRDTER